MHWWRHPILIAIACGCGRPGAEPRAVAPDCDSARVVGKLPAELSEVSGIALSRRTPGIFWIHNDDDPAVLFAIDTTGTIKARVAVSGLAGIDWEDLAAAPCGDDSCLFIGDIGDNLQTRDDRAIYRVVEPKLTDRVTTKPIRYSFRTPDKSHDAESLIVMPDGRFYLVSKGRSGPITVFAFPQPPDSTSEAELAAVATLSEGLVQLPDMATGGAAVDENTVAIRTYSALQFYSIAGNRFTPLYEASFDLRSLDEPQGEGIAVRADGVVFLVSERSMTDAAPISRLRCRLP
ncbi:MAG: hypothetical protein ACT4O1_06650 [Gemmatimonadota bacterium]